MEIITIPLSGALKHQDSMGFSEIIEAGEVQVMSAGTGIYHSEFNPNPNQAVNLFQIWIFPNRKQVEPRYAQQKYELQNGAFSTLVGPENSGVATWIHQDAWISMGDFTADTQTSYTIQSSGNGVYIMVVEGEIQIGDQQLKKRDAIGISQTEKVEINCKQNAKILVIEVPMN
jgi:redox-sensitive bicupin YhaK (pirin superfamily)